MIQVHCKVAGEHRVLEVDLPLAEDIGEDLKGAIEEALGGKVEGAILKCATSS